MADKSPDTAPELRELYGAFETNNMSPLWTQVGDLLPFVPAPKAQAHVWRWSVLHDLAERAGSLVPVGRGGERRAIALSNPGLPGTPFITSTLWCAIQWLGAHDTAPEHRHSQNA